MPRRATGAVIAHRGRDGRNYHALRFTAYGKRRYVSLGAVSAEDAARELRHVLADVERGTWTPSAASRAVPEPTPIPTFHEFSEEWWTVHAGRLAPNTTSDYRWRLEVHLIPWFGELLIDAITFDTVERYIAVKLAEDRPLSPRSINMTVSLLRAIMERAVERDLIPRNPATGRARRVRERAPERSYLQSAGQIAALLDAAGELDAEARSGPYRDRARMERRAMLAVLIFAGLRIGELCSLRWRDLDLAAGWLAVGEAKTAAGRRRVRLRGALRDELLSVRSRRPDDPQDAFVFSTSTGARMSPDNFRTRVIGRAGAVVDGERPRPGTGAVVRANERLAAAGFPPLPKLTPHSLRRTFCSLLYALGEDPGTVMDEMGHTDPGLALRVYRQAMRRGEAEQDALHALVEGSRSLGQEVLGDLGRMGVVVEDRE